MTALLVALVCTSLLATAGQDAGSDLREGIYREVALGNPEEALEFYRRVLGDEEGDSELRARALQRIAVCLAKLGRGDDAEEALRSLKERFPGRDGFHAVATMEVGRVLGRAKSRFGRPRIEELLLATR